jgi:hypothetical protein
MSKRNSIASSIHINFISIIPLVVLGTLVRGIIGAEKVGADHAELYVTAKAAIVRQTSSRSETLQAARSQRSHLLVNKSRLKRRSRVVRRVGRNAEMAGMTPMYLQGPWTNQMTQLAIQRTSIEQSEHQLERQFQESDFEPPTGFSKLLLTLSKEVEAAEGSVRASGDMKAASAAVAVPTAVIALVGLGGYMLAKKPGASSGKGENQKEDPQTIEELCSILACDSNIKLGCWGRCDARDVGQLFREIQEGQAELRWETSPSGGRRLQRKTKSISIKLSAVTAQGERYLCRLGDSDVTVASSIRLKEGLEEKKSTLLAECLELDVPWIRKHLCAESQHSRISITYGDDEVLEDHYPGLCTRHRRVCMKVKVKNPHAATVKGKLGLPAGGEFAIKGQRWQWLVPQQDSGSEDMASNTSTSCCSSSSDATEDVGKALQTQLLKLSGSSREDAHEK